MGSRRKHMSGTANAALPPASSRTRCDNKGGEGDFAGGSSTVMAPLVACSCLNVVVGGAGGAGGGAGEPLPPGAFPADATDPFFSLRLGLAPAGGEIACACAEPALLSTHRCGEWTVCGCLLCGDSTHALNAGDPSALLLNLSLATDPERVAALRREPRYSEVFGVLVDESASAGPPGAERSHPAAEALGRKLRSAIRAELEAAEERVARFREETFSRAEAFRERANTDYRNICSSLAMHIAEEPASDPSEPSVPMSLRRSISEDAQSVPQHVTPKKSESKNMQRVVSHKEDSLDSEGIFDLEGMDSSGSPRDDRDSDAYDSDYDDSVSRDEGIHIARNSNSDFSMAKSLPVDVPNFTQAMNVIRDNGVDRHADDPNDIAASIRALARSVHGDVYELPRPRFSTQI